MWFLWWMKQSWTGFFLGFVPFSSATNIFPLFLHTDLVRFVLFHFIHPCDGAAGVVGPSYSQTFNKGASSHLIPWPDPVSDMNRGYLFKVAMSSAIKNRQCMKITICKIVIWILYVNKRILFLMERCLVKRKNDKNEFKINDAFLNTSFGHFKRRLAKPGINVFLCV